ncbi:MAG TPA: PEGA domain-containing protein [Polyangiaceae bacterium]|nr:PEGA domain-containing protein [Polyangiaceae bacterium]
MQRLLGFFFTLALALGVATAAHADEPRKAAGEHYQRGLELADRGDYKTALEEFERAYALSPNFAVLYNIGQADVELGRPAKAIDALERYLGEGKTKVPPARRAEVERQLGQLRSSFAELGVTTTPPGARITVDGAEVGATPLAKPLMLTAGSHVVAASRPGAETETRVVVVNEGQKTELSLELPDLPPPVVANALGAEQGAGTKGAETKPPAPLVATGAAPGANDRAHASFPTGYVLIGSGVVLGGATVAHYFWNHGRVEEYRANEAALATDTSPGRSERQAANNELATSIQHASVVTVVLGAASGALVAAGTVLVVLDQKARKKHASGGWELPDVAVTRDSVRLSWGSTW